MSDSLHLEIRKMTAGRSMVAPTLFGRLDPNLQERLRKAAPLRSFTDGAIIQQRGDTPSGFWLIETGSVTVGQFLAEGQFRALAVLGPADSYGELALFSGKRRVVDAVARGAADLRWIDGARFEAALADDPASMRRMLGALAEELQEMLGVITGLRRGSAKRRISAMLINLTGSDILPSKIIIGQDEIAELAGVTRATVNKVLRELEQGRVLLRGYGMVEIIDPAGLRLAAST